MELWVQPTFRWSAKCAGKTYRRTDWLLQWRQPDHVFIDQLPCPIKFPLTIFCYRHLNFFYRLLFLQLRPSREKDQSKYTHTSLFINTLLRLQDLTIRFPIIRFSFCSNKCNHCRRTLPFNSICFVINTNTAPLWFPFSSLEILLLSVHIIDFNAVKSGPVLYNLSVKIYIYFLSPPCLFHRTIVSPTRFLSF